MRLILEVWRYVDVYDRVILFYPRTAFGMMHVVFWHDDLHNYVMTLWAMYATDNAYVS